MVEFPRIKYSIWVCPECDRTVKAPKISIYQPDTICKCMYPEYVIQMTLLSEITRN